MKGARRTRKPRHHTGFAELMAPQGPASNPRGVITGFGRNNYPSTTSVRSPPQPTSPAPPSVDDDWSSLLNSTPPRRPSPSASPPGPPKSNSVSSMRSLSSQAAKSVPDTIFSPKQTNMDNPRSPDKMGPSSPSASYSFTGLNPSYSAEPVSSFTHVPVPPAEPVVEPAPMLAVAPAPIEWPVVPPAPAPKPAAPPAPKPTMVPAPAPKPTAVPTPATGSVPSFMSGWEGADGWGDDPSLDDSDSDLNVEDDAWGASWSPLASPSTIAKPESETKPPPQPETSFVTTEPPIQQTAPEPTQTSSFFPITESPKPPPPSTAIASEPTQDAVLLAAFEPTDDAEDESADAWGAWDDVAIPEEQEPEANQEHDMTVAEATPQTTSTASQSIPPQIESNILPPEASTAPENDSQSAPDQHIPEHQNVQEISVSQSREAHSASPLDSRHSEKPVVFFDDVETAQEEFQSSIQQQSQYPERSTPDANALTVEPRSISPNVANENMRTSDNGAHITDLSVELHHDPIAEQATISTVEQIAAEQVQVAAPAPEVVPEVRSESLTTERNPEISAGESNVPDTTSQVEPILSNDEAGWAWNPEEAGDVQKGDNELRNNREAGRTDGYPGWDYEEVDAGPGDSAGWGWGSDTQVQNSSDTFGFEVGISATPLPQQTADEGVASPGKSGTSNAVVESVGDRKDISQTTNMAWDIGDASGNMTEDLEAVEKTDEVQPGETELSEQPATIHGNMVAEANQDSVTAINISSPPVQLAPHDIAYQEPSSATVEDIPSQPTDFQVQPDTVVQGPPRGVTVDVEHSTALDTPDEAEINGTNRSPRSGSGVEFNSTDVDVSSIRGLTEVPSVVSDRENVQNAVPEQAPLIKDNNDVEGPTTSECEDRSWVLDVSPSTNSPFPTISPPEEKSVAGTFAAIGIEQGRNNTNEPWGAAAEPQEAESSVPMFPNSNLEQHEAKAVVDTEAVFNGAAYAPNPIAQNNHQAEQKLPVPQVQLQNADSYWDSLAQSVQDEDAGRDGSNDVKGTGQFSSTIPFPSNSATESAGDPWGITSTSDQQEYNSFWTEKLDSSASLEERDQLRPSSASQNLESGKDIAPIFRDASQDQAGMQSNVAIDPQGGPPPFPTNSAGYVEATEAPNPVRRNEEAGPTHYQQADSSQFFSANDMWGDPTQTSNLINDESARKGFGAPGIESGTAPVPIPTAVDQKEDLGGIDSSEGIPAHAVSEERRDKQEGQSEYFENPSESTLKSPTVSEKVAKPAPPLDADTSLPNASQQPSEGHDPFMYMTAADSRSQATNVGFDWIAIEGGQSDSVVDQFGAEPEGSAAKEVDSSEQVSSYEPNAPQDTLPGTNLWEQHKPEVIAHTIPSVDVRAQTSTSASDQEHGRSSATGNDEHIPSSVQGRFPLDEGPSYAPRISHPSSDAPFWDGIASNQSVKPPREGERSLEHFESVPSRPQENIASRGVPGPSPPLPERIEESNPTRNDVASNSPKAYHGDASEVFISYAPQPSVQQTIPSGLHTYSPKVVSSPPSSGDHKASDSFPGISPRVSSDNSLDMTDSFSAPTVPPPSEFATFNSYAPRPPEATSAKDVFKDSPYIPGEPPVDQSSQNPDTTGDQAPLYDTSQSNANEYAPIQATQEFATDGTFSQYAPRISSTVTERFPVDQPTFQATESPFTTQSGESSSNVLHPDMQENPLDSRAPHDGAHVPSAVSPPQQTFSGSVYDSQNTFVPAPMSGSEMMGEYSEPYTSGFQPIEQQNETSTPYAPIPPTFHAVSEPQNPYAPNAYEKNDSSGNVASSDNHGMSHPQNLSQEVGSIYAPHMHSQAPQSDESPWYSGLADASTGFTGSDKHEIAPETTDPSMKYAPRNDGMLPVDSRQEMMPEYPEPPVESIPPMQSIDTSLYNEQNNPASHLQPPPEADIYKPVQQNELQTEYSGYDDMSTYAYPYSIMDTAQIGELEHRPPRPIISWGFGGTLVTIIPKGGETTDGLGSNISGLQRSDVCILDMKHIVHDGVDDELVSATKAISPLPYPVKPADLLQYGDMCEHLSNCSAGLSGSAAESRAALWRLLALMCRQSNSEWRNAASSAISGPSHIKMFERSNSAAALSGHAQSDSPLRVPGEGSEITNEDKREAAARVEELMTQGKGREAIMRAQEAGLWPLALILAATVDKSLYMQIITQFAKSNLNDGSALQTLCLSMAENDAEIMRRATSESGLDEWRKTVGVLLTSQRSMEMSRGTGSLRMIEQVGEALISRRNDRVAGHVCFLLSGRIAALDPKSFPLLATGTSEEGGRYSGRYSASAALQSLVFEAVVNAQKGESFPHILPFRFMLAQEIANVGHPELALEHCVSVSSTIRTLFESQQGVAASQLFTQPFLHSVELLEQRLRGHLGLQPALERRGALSGLGQSLSAVFRGRNAEEKKTQMPPAGPNTAIAQPGEGQFDSRNQSKQAQRMSVSHDSTPSMEQVTPSWSQPNTSAPAMPPMRTPPPPESHSGNERWNSLISNTIRVLAPADGDLSPPPRHRMDGTTAFDQQPTPDLGLGHGTGTRTPGQDLSYSHLRSASMGDMQSAMQSGGQAGDMNVFSNPFGSNTGNSLDTAATATTSTIPNPQAAVDRGARHRRTASDMTPGSQASEKKPPRPPKSSTTKSSVNEGSGAGLDRPMFRSFRSRLGDAIKSAFKGPKQAHMGSENKFKFDKDRGWYIEGEEAAAEQSIPPPPPDDDVMGDVGGMDNASISSNIDYGMSNVQSMQSSPPMPPAYDAPNMGMDSAAVAAPTLNTSLAYGASQSWASTPEATSESSVGSASSAPTPYMGAYPSGNVAPTSSNKYRADARRRSGSRAYVDTFNPNASNARAQPSVIRPTPSAIAGFGGAGGGGAAYKIFTPTPAAASSVADTNDSSLNSQSARDSVASTSANEYSDTTGVRQGTAEAAPTNAQAYMSNQSSGNRPPNVPRMMA